MSRPTHPAPAPTGAADHAPGGQRDRNLGTSPAGSAGGTVVMGGTPCVSCHRDGSFTYHDGARWIERAPSVPASALARLPADERARVERVAWRRMGDR